MNKDHDISQKRFYLVTTDILVGFSIFIMVIGHTTLWWDKTIDTKWPNLPLITWLFLVIAFLVPPGFLFWYSFNTVNSLLRKIEKEKRNESRHRLIKRAIIFFLIAELGELATAIVLSNNWLNYLLTWELFHMFSFSTLFILIVFEIAWINEKHGYGNFKQACSIIFICVLIFVLSFFLLFHDYSQTLRFKHAVDLNFQSVLKRMIFEEGQSPIIPWLSFPVAGGLLATYLDLPNENRKTIRKKAITALIIGIVFFIGGIWFLNLENYVSTVVMYPSSSNLVFIAIGTHIITTVGGILILDLKSLYVSDISTKVNKTFLPLILVSKISLTIYLVHNIVFVFPSDVSRVVIPSVEIAMIVGLIYSICFVYLAFLWQKQGYKYSIEWILSYLQTLQWRWWIEKPVSTIISQEKILTHIVQSEEEYSE